MAGETLCMQMSRLSRNTVSVVNLSTWGWSWVLIDEQQKKPKMWCASLQLLKLDYGPSPGSKFNQCWCIIFFVLGPFWVSVDLLTSKWGSTVPSSAAVGLMHKSHIASQQDIWCLRTRIVFRWVGFATGLHVDEEDGARKGHGCFQ